MAVNPYDGAGYGCGIGYGYCGTPASAGALDILASVGTSTSPTSTGTKAVTGVGFQPKSILFSNVAQIADGVLINPIGSFGACDGTLNAAVGFGGISGVTTSQTWRNHTGSSSTFWSISSAGIGGEVAAVTSLDSDGFTRNWTASGVTQYLYNHIALGGADLEVSLTQHQMNATNADESFAHGLSGAPTGVLFFSAINSTAPANTSSPLQLSIGAWSAANQFAAGVYSANSVTTTLTRRLLSNTSCINYFASGSLRSMAVGSVDSTNVNVTYPVSANANQNYFWMLSIRVAKCHVATFNCVGSTSPLPIDCGDGFTPVAVLGVVVPSGVSLPDSIRSDAHLGLFAADGETSLSCGISDENGRISGTNSRRWQDSDDVALYDVSGTEQFRSKVSFSGQNVVITPAVANAGYDQGALLVIGK